jgi:hypothetical protein
MPMRHRGEGGLGLSRSAETSTRAGEMLRVAELGGVLSNRPQDQEQGLPCPCVTAERGVLDCPEALKPEEAPRLPSRVDDG